MRGVIFLFFLMPDIGSHYSVRVVYTPNNNVALYFNQTSSGVRVQFFNSYVCACYVILLLMRTALLACD